MKRQLAAFSVLVLSSLALAQTVPTKPDFSTPKSAFSAFATAVVAQDVAAIRQAMVVSPADAPSVDAILGATGAFKHLVVAVTNKLGEAAATQMRRPGTLDVQMIKWLKLLDTAQVKEEDTTAAIMFPAAGQSRMGIVLLVKSGNDWKVTADSVFNFANPTVAQKIKEAIPKYNKMADAYNQVAIEVEQGKHTELKSVQDSLMPKVNAIFSKDASATPATQK